MAQDISIAEAKDNLTRILRGVENGDHVHITRRGKPVAVLLSISTFKELKRKRLNFAEALAEFNTRPISNEAVIDDAFLSGLRDRTPDRTVEI